MSSSAFSISASPSTDIWRKPPSTNRFNAPTAHTTRGKLASFTRAQITLTLPPRSGLILYDQGGILLSIIKPGADADEASKSQWLKSGIEWYLDEPWIGTVGTDRWADWSVSPLPGSDDRPTVTIELERSKDELGKSLWVYAILPPTTGGALRRELKKVPLREVGWFFENDGDDLELAVSAYAARPKKNPANEAEELTVDFQNFVVEWK